MEENLNEVIVQNNLEENVEQNAEKDDAFRWYVVHTFAGYENRVKETLDQMIQARGLGSMIEEVNIPEEEVVEIKNGERNVKRRKIFPSYVMVKMAMSDEAWYIVRNTRGVTGFVGADSRAPIPLTDEEVKSMGADQHIIRLNFEVGQNVRIAEGALGGFTGIVKAVDKETETARVSVSMFGRETEVELKFVQLERVEEE